MKYYKKLVGERIYLSPKGISDEEIYKFTEWMNDFEITDDGIILKDSDKSTTPLSDWFKYGCAKICVYVDSEEELMNIADKAKEKGIIAAVITDAGMTEFHGVPTKTCLALEPLPTDVADELTGNLPLY